MGSSQNMPLNETLREYFPLRALRATRMLAAIFVAQMATGQRGPSKKPDEGPGRDD